MLFENTLENLSSYGEGILEGKNKKFSEIAFNSKNINKGDVFIPLKGKNFDGHDFIDEAYKNGAVSVVSERKLENKDYIFVKDTHRFLKRLSEKQRDLFSGYVIGVTGSNGKTTTKEILSDLIQNSTNSNGVLRSKGSLNNFFGLCFSLVKLKTEHKFACFEIGTNNKGEISELSKILSPNMSIVTNIGQSHLAGLSSLSGVAQEKSDIFKFTKDGGVCIGRIQNEFKELFQKKAKDKTFINLDADPKTNVDPNYEIAIKALQYLQNETGLKKVESERFSTNNIVSGRFEVKVSQYGPLIIDDTYNANPDSFKFAFRKIKNFLYEKKICIMGEMGELGSFSLELHKEILSLAAKNFDVVIAVDFKTDFSSPNLNYFSRKETLKELEKYKSKDFLIFFKGSRSVKMEELATVFI